MRIAFPVFDDIADVEYHIAQRKQNLSIDGGAFEDVSPPLLRGASKRWKLCHHDGDLDVRKRSPSFLAKPGNQLFFSSKMPQPPFPCGRPNPFPIP